MARSDLRERSSPAPAAVPALNDRFWHGPVGYAHAMRSATVQLPSDLVARYRAVDREVVGSALVDTPAHLDRLTSDIGQRGILVPLDLKFNQEFATLDGNHRIAVALRLGLEHVPVALHQLPEYPRPSHAKPMADADHRVLIAAWKAIEG